MVGQASGCDPVGGEDLMHHAEQEVRVRAGPNRNVAACRLGRTTSPRIDHDDLTTPSEHRLQPTRQIWGGPQAAVGRIGIRAEDEEEFRTVDVGHGDREWVPEEVATRDVLGHLVHSGCRIDVPGAEGLAQRRGIEIRGEAVHGGIAEVQGHRISAVRVDDPGQAGLGGRERLIPARRHEFAVPPYPWRAEPVGIGVELTERCTLGADETPAEHIGLVPAYLRDLVANHRQLQAAGRLAQRTRGVPDAHRITPPGCASPP